MIGLRPQHELEDLLQIAGLARGTFYYHQRQATERSTSQGNMQDKIRAVYDEHTGRYGF